MTIQFTLTTTQGYRPISTLVEVADITDYLKHKEHYRNKAVKAMCLKRGWTLADLKKYGYTEMKKRVYDKERIEKEKEERYAQIKKERGWN